MVFAGGFPVWSGLVWFGSVRLGGLLGFGFVTVASTSNLRDREVQWESAVLRVLLQVHAKHDCRATCRRHHHRG